MDSIHEHLKALSERDLVPMNHKLYLMKLKTDGFEPKVVYDIGACVLHWTSFAKTLWPSAQYVAFDAFDQVEFLYQEAGIPYHMGVLSDVDGREVKFYQNDMLPGGNSYYREIGCQGGRFFPADTYKVYNTRTLDSVVNEYKLPLPDLVKIDVQGAEKDVVAGGINSMLNAQHLVVEMQNIEYNEGAPMVDTTLPYIEQVLGVKCVAPLFCNNGADGDYGFARV